MIYSMVVSACLTSPTEATNHAKEVNLFDTWPVCLAKTLQIASDRCTTQNSLSKNGIIKTLRNLMIEWNHQTKGKAEMQVYLRNCKTKDSDIL